MYKLSRIAAIYYRDTPQRDYGERGNDCVVFRRTDCINEMSDHVLEFKGEAKRVKNKIVKHNVYFLAHKRPGFDSYVVFNKLPQ